MRKRFSSGKSKQNTLRNVDNQNERGRDPLRLKSLRCTTFVNAKERIDWRVNQNLFNEPDFQIFKFLNYKIALPRLIKKAELYFLLNCKSCHHQ